MRLLFRHVRKSILKAPKESLVLIVTLLVSVFLFASIAEVYRGVIGERELSYDTSYGESDIVLSAGSIQNTRFLSYSSLFGYEDEFSSALGVLELPFSDGGEGGLCASCDVSSIGEMFPLLFEEIRPVDENRLYRAAYVSREYAERRELSLGSPLTLYIMGAPRTFTVEGIHITPFFGSSDILLDDEGMLDHMSSVSPMFSLFDEENPPCTAIYLDLKEDENLDAVETALTERGFSVYKPVGTGSSRIYIMQSVALAFMLLLSMVIACILVSFSLRLLSDARREQLEVFRLVGMGNGALFAVFLLEVLVYLLLGLGLGILLAWLLIPAILGDVLALVSISLSPFGIALALVSVLAVCIFGLLLHFFFMSHPYKSPTKRARIIAFLTFLSLSLVFGILAFTVSVGIRYILAIFATLFLLATLFCGMPLLLSLLSGFIAPRIKGSAAFFLALKNNNRIPQMRHLHALLAVVLSAGVALVSAYSACMRIANDMQSFFTPDYVITGEYVNESLKSISELRGTEACTSVYFEEAILEDGEKLILLSLDDMSFLSDPLKSAPEGNEVYLSETLSAAFGVDIGGEITVYVGNEPESFVLKGYIDDNCYFAIINSHDMGYTPNAAFIKATGTDEEYEKGLSEIAGMSASFVFTREGLLDEYTSPLFNFCELMRAFLSIVAVLALIGCSNLIYVGYSRRREHFRTLSIVGMTRADLAGMCIAEWLALIVTVLVSGLLTATGFCFFLESASNSFGFSIFGI